MVDCHHGEGILHYTTNATTLCWITTTSLKLTQVRDPSFNFSQKWFHQRPNSFKWPLNTTTIKWTSVRVTTPFQAPVTSLGLEPLVRWLIFHRQHLLTNYYQRRSTLQLQGSYQTSLEKHLPHLFFNWPRTFVWLETQEVRKINTKIGWVTTRLI